MATASRRRAQKKYNSKPEQVNRREKRNKARYQMIKKGKAKKGDGKDVAHKDGNVNHNVPMNWAMATQHSNRSYPRTKGGRKKNRYD
jgi:hypothetical protein